MNLHEALNHSSGATKHVDTDEEGQIAGTYSVDKANLSAGYYKDFQADDPERRFNVNTSSYYGFDYPGADPLESISQIAGEDGWKPRRH